MTEDQKWAGNIAFVGSKDTVKKILEFVENLENEGKITDYTGIEGPHESLQLMLKRRVENLALEVSTPPLLASSNKNSVDDDDSDNEGNMNE